jgi:hypothetical protein
VVDRKGCRIAGASTLPQRYERVILGRKRVPNVDKKQSRNRSSKGAEQRRKRMVERVRAGGGDARTGTGVSRQPVGGSTVVGRANGQRLDRVDWSSKPTSATRPGNRTTREIEAFVLTVREQLGKTSDLGEHGAEAIYAALADHAVENRPFGSHDRTHPRAKRSLGWSAAGAQSCSADRMVPTRSRCQTSRARFVRHRIGVVARRRHRSGRAQRYLIAWRASYVVAAVLGYGRADRLFARLALATVRSSSVRTVRQRQHLPRSPSLSRRDGSSHPDLPSARCRTCLCTTS